MVGGSLEGSRASWVNGGLEGWPGPVPLFSQGESSGPCCWLPWDLVGGGM